MRFIIINKVIATYSGPYPGGVQTNRPQKVKVKKKVH